MVSFLILFLLVIPVYSYAGNAIAGWNFDITGVSAEGTAVDVAVCSHSNQGLNGPVMVICNVKGRDFKKDKVHLNSGECRTIRFDIPSESLFPTYEAARKIAGSKPPAGFHSENVNVSIKGGGIGGVGYGLWQFDYWSGKLQFQY